MIAHLECGHHQQVDAEPAAGSLRICRQGDCGATMDGDTRRAIVSCESEPVDDTVMDSAVSGAENFAMAGRQVMREFLRTIPDPLRERIGRLILRSLLVELEELPETICGEPE